MKYKKPLIFIFITYAFFASIIVLTIFNPSPNEKDMTPFIPGTLTIEFFIQFLVIIPLGAIIGSFLGCLFAPIFLMVHKKTVGRKFSYSIQERPSSEKFKHFLRGLFPSLMAINFGLMLSNNTQLVELILTKEALETSEAAIIVLFVLFLMGWTLGAAFGLFSSVWFLIEAGIVFDNKEKVKDSEFPVEVRSVGGWYSYLLKGYAGISVILSLYQITSEEILMAGETGNIALLLTLIFFPLFIVILVLPSVVVFDIFQGPRNKYIRRFAHKIGILTITELDIREVQK